MKKFLKLLSLLLALCLLCGSALAEGVSSAPIATYTLPRGAEGEGWQCSSAGVNTQSSASSS